MAIAPPRSRPTPSRSAPAGRPPAARVARPRPPAGRPSGSYRPRHRRPPRYGLRRFVALLVLLLLVGLGWRATGFLRHGSGIAAAPVAAAGGGLAPLAGPHHVSPAQTHDALDRFISYGYPVYCGGGNKPLVALTFDDGPGPYTQEVLDMLHRAGARATFFIVGKEIEGWPQLADEPRKEASIGAIGDHTWDHVDLTSATADELQHEIVDSQQLIAQHSGA